MKTNPTPVPEKEEWEIKFYNKWVRNGWAQCYEENGSCGCANPNEIIDFISSQKSQSFNEGYLKALDELEKGIERYKCDFNWDFEKGKAKHKSYIAIDDINKKLEELRKGK